MRTFIVEVRERRVRAVSVTKLVSVAENGERAVEMVKGFYGPNCHGWNENAEFILREEIQPYTPKMV